MQPFLLSHFGGRQLRCGHRHRRAVVWKDHFRSVCLSVIPLGPRMEQLEPHPITVQTHKTWSEVLHRDSLQNKTEKSKPRTLKSLIFNCEVMNGGSCWVLYFSFWVNLVLFLATESWLLEKDYFKLKFSSKFPLPDCKTHNYTQFCPAGQLRILVCFSKSTERTLFEHLNSHMCTFVWITKHAQASESSLCYFFYRYNYTPS